jgi:hypothetical protein
MEMKRVVNKSEASFRFNLKLVVPPADEEQGGNDASVQL